MRERRIGIVAVIALTAAALTGSPAAAALAGEPAAGYTTAASAAAAAASGCRSIPVEADGPLRSAEARERFGVDGAGVTVGIISDSYGLNGEVTTPAQDVVSGVLPGPGNPCGFETPVEVLREGSDGSDEGRAMAQLVHGIAPGARLLFAADGGGVEAAAEAVRMLAEAGATVIVDDVSPIGELAFQKSVLSSTIDEVREQYGVSYLTSAGNENVVSTEGRPIGGWRTPAYRPMECPAWVSLDEGIEADCLDFDPGAGEDATDTLTTSAGDAGANPHLLLQWGEPAFGVQTALAVQLYRQGDSGPELVVEATADDPDQPEVVVGTLDEPWQEGDYDLVVVRTDRADGVPPAVWWGQTQNTGVIVDVEYDTDAGGDVVGPVTYGHQADGSSLVIGAAAWTTPETLHPTSSIGPGLLLFEPVVAGATTPAAPLAEPFRVPTPSAVAVDGTRTSFFGWPFEEDGQTVHRFFGTSAAAPNAAAVLALGFSYAPEAGADAIEEAALATATPLANPYSAWGFADEDVVGAGLLDSVALLEALPAPSPPGPTPAPTPVPDVASGPSARLADTGAGELVGAVPGAWIVAVLLMLAGGAAALRANRSGNGSGNGAAGRGLRRMTGAARGGHRG